MSPDHEPGCAESDQAGVRGGQNHEEGVVVGKEHQSREQSDHGGQLRGHQRRERRQLTAYASDPVGPGGDQIREQHRRGTERRQDLNGLQERGRP